MRFFGMIDLDNDRSVYVQELPGGGVAIAGLAIEEPAFQESLAGEYGPRVGLRKIAFTPEGATAVYELLGEYLDTRKTDDLRTLPPGEPDEEVP